jgi:hypothetical protein
VQRHGDAEPLVGSFAPPQELCCEHGMAVAEDIGPDVDLLADDALDWKTAAIDDGVNVFDVDAMLGKVTDGPDAGVSCHGSIALCRPVDPPGRRKGIDANLDPPGLVPGHI